jgi:hypothetical protein
LAVIHTDQPGYPVTIRSLLRALPELDHVVDLCVSPDEQSLYVYCGADGWWFAAIDFTEDTLLFSQELPGNFVPGGVTMTPDGGRVFYTHARNTDWGWGVPPAPEFYIFEPAISSAWKKRVVDLDYVYLDYWYVDSLPIRDLAITPDNRWLVCTSAGRPMVLLYDLHTLNLVHIFTDYYMSTGYLTCQRYGPPPARPIDTTSSK